MGNINKASKKAALEEKIAALERKLFEARAQYVSTLGDAFDKITKAADYHGSGVILEVTAIGGKQVVPPVMVRDGLSPATIKAIQDDFRRSLELATLVSPLMARA